MERTCHGDQPEEAVMFLIALVIVCLEFREKSPFSKKKKAEPL
jgi:hypothetical protein